MTKLRCTMVADPNQGRIVNGIVNRYGYFVKDGEKVFGKIGEIDAQVDIQSFLESCDYRIIMQSLISQLGSDFNFDPMLAILQEMDVSDPISVASYIEILQDDFASLPVEVKNHYENNPKLFARDCVNGSVIDFIRSFTQSDDGSETPVETSEQMANAVGKSGQPDIAGIMRQIDAINQKLNGETEKGESK